MKILVAYDGSDCAEAALDDLKAAGLPAQTEAHVISVAEVWLPPPPKGWTLERYTNELRSHAQPFASWQTNAAEVDEAASLAARAARRLRSMFPEWKVTSEGAYGSPAWEIIDNARRHASDLIVVGSHGRTALGRFFLGSISQKVLTEADCSVRVARGKIEVEPGPARIVIGYDTSVGSEVAVAAAASRNWPQGSEATLVAVTTGDQLCGDGSEFDWLDDRGRTIGLTADAILKLRNAGLKANFRTDHGSPKIRLVEIAEQSGASSIFVGATRFGGPFERYVLGSVAAAVAARAHCSVEVVRKRS
jgi:nucleotide-binding universal stress UspA family protein